MKVFECDEPDRHGRMAIRFTGVKSSQEIYDYLFKHYHGYKFGMVIDVSHDEYPLVGNEWIVYFLDEMADEVMSYSDYVYNQDQRIWKKRSF